MKNKMIFQKTNIEKALFQLKKRLQQEQQILDEVRLVLAGDSRKREKISKNLKTKAHVDGNDFIFDLLETDKIYTIGQIKKICIDYRLRFLDSRYFKSEISNSAIAKIKELESMHATEIKGFKIMAPSRLFKLEDRDDPLLFAPIGNGYFYLVHKWGNDLHPFRKLLVWPFKSIVNLTFFMILVSYPATLLVPEGLFSKNSSTVEFWIIYFFMFKCIASVVIFYGFALGKNFNPTIWNSKYFNA